MNQSLFSCFFWWQHEVHDTLTRLVEHQTNKLKIPASHFFFFLWLSLVFLWKAQISHWKQTICLPWSIDHPETNGIPKGDCILMGWQDAWLMHVWLACDLNIQLGHFAVSRPSNWVNKLTVIRVKILRFVGTVSKWIRYFISLSISSAFRFHLLVPAHLWLKMLICM